MKVILVTHGFPPYQSGGVENYTAALADSLVRAGVEPFVFTSSYTSRTAVDSAADYENVQVRRFFSPRRQIRLRFHDEAVERAFLAYVDQVRPDAVHVQHLLSLTVPLISLVKRLGIPVVVTLHDFWFLCPEIQQYRRACHPLQGQFAGLNCYAHIELRPRMLVSMLIRATILRRARLHLQRARLMRIELAAADAIVVPSRFVWRTFSAAGIDLSSAQLITHGIEELPHVDRPPADSGTRVGYLGGIARSKGVDLLVRAFRAIEDPNARLSLCGPEVDPRFALKLRRAISSDPRVSLNPAIPRPAVGEFLSRLDLLVIPSRLDESFSLVAREALSAGVPVLASDTGALSEVIFDGENGLLFERGSGRDLRRQLEALIREPEKLAGLRKPSAIKTMDEHAREIRSLYEDVRGRAAASHPGDERYSGKPS